MLADMKRLECLDGLRGALAVYVLVGHMAPFGALPAPLQNLVSHGNAAVEVFFILSGLVITQSLYRAGGHISGVPAGVRIRGHAPGDIVRLRLHALDRTGQPGEDDLLRRGLAQQLGYSDGCTSDNDPRSGSRRRVA
jgi:hypothetical protein